MCKTTEHVRIKIHRTVNTFRLMAAQRRKEIRHFIHLQFESEIQTQSVCVDWKSLSLFCLRPTGLLLEAQIFSSC